MDNSENMSISLEAQFVTWPSLGASHRELLFREAIVSLKIVTRYVCC